MFTYILMALLFYVMGQPRMAGGIIIFGLIMECAGKS